MEKRRKDYLEGMNEIKRIFDHFGINRLNISDDFFIEIIKAIESKSFSDSVFLQMAAEQTTDFKDIKNKKMELMINVEGVINQMKGKTRFNRYAFGLDIRKLPLTVFLTETKVLIRDMDFKKSDMIIFYDDTTLRNGSRGFGLTRDAIVTNISGIFKVLRFDEMEREPEFVIGLKRDAFRIHFDHTSFDIKVHKNITHTAIVYDMMKLLYQYAQEVIKDREKR